MDTSFSAARRRPVLRLSVCLLLAGCGTSVATGNAARSSTAAELPAEVPDSSRSGGDSRTCAAIAVEYQAAIATAVACDPTASDPCGAQRPVAVGIDGQADGLCVASGAGHVPASHTGTLDQLLARFQAAGCEVGRCPGLADHPPRCVPEGATTVCK